jgi:predicted anti-sigma-YlaC factor YlaD
MADPRDILTRWHCRRLAAALVDHAEGELAERARPRVERHLERCPRCREELAALREVPALLGDADIARDETFWRRQRQDVMRAVRNQAEPAPSRSRFSRFAWQGAVAAVATAAIVLAGIATLHHPQPTRLSRAPLPADVDALDPDTKAALSDVAATLVPLPETMPATTQNDDLLLAAAAREAWDPSHVLEITPEIADLSDQDLETLDEMVGGNFS